MKIYLIPALVVAFAIGYGYLKNNTPPQPPNFTPTKTNPGYILSKPTLRLPGYSLADEQPLKWDSERTVKMIMPMMANQINPSAAEIAAYNDLHIIPYQHQHPYADLDDADLEHLATTDAAAAYLMMDRAANQIFKFGSGQQWTQEKDDSIMAVRTKWLLRAVALSEKTGPLIAINVMNMTRPYIDKNVPVPNQVMRALIIETVAAKLGDPRANPKQYAEMLYGYTDPDLIELFPIWETLVDQTVNGWMQEMVTIQRDITGSVQVWESLQDA